MQELKITNHFLKICTEVVMAGGKIAKENFHNNNEIFHKADNSLVTPIDTLAEKAMRDIIHQNFPKHSILGEELGGSLENNQHIWIFDPIDGTRNYINKNKIYACGASLVKDGEIIVNSLFIPEEDKLLVAQKGKGTFWNGKKLTIKNNRPLRSITIGTSRPNYFKKEFDQQIDKVKPHISEIKSFGSGLYSIACIAEQKVDAVICYTPKEWDVAPAILLAQEAGAIALDYSGNPWKLGTPELILAPPKLAHQIANLIEKNE